MTKLSPPPSGASIVLRSRFDPPLQGVVQIATGNGVVMELLRDVVDCGQVELEIRDRSHGDVLYVLLDSQLQRGVRQVAGDVDRLHRDVDVREHGVRGRGIGIEIEVRRHEYSRVEGRAVRRTAGKVEEVALDRQGHLDAFAIEEMDRCVACPRPVSEVLRVGRPGQWHRPLLFEVEQLRMFGEVVQEELVRRVLRDLEDHLPPVVRPGHLVPREEDVDQYRVRSAVGRVAAAGTARSRASAATVHLVIRCARRATTAARASSIRTIRAG